WTRKRLTLRRLETSSIASSRVCAGREGELPTRRCSRATSSRARRFIPQHDLLRRRRR
ncbi:MAG: hypothetical protein AVDCRST_MAG86-2980, partial [uncultured Truepera sp.]